MMFAIIRKNRDVLFFICVIGCLTLIGCDGGNDRNGGEPKPKEVPQAQHSPLPAIWDQVRAGHWIHGINWPWDNYGGDFGFNLWGYRGLANQGPSGWRREIRDNNNAAKRLFWAERGNDDYCIGVDVKLNGALSNAIVYFHVDEIAEKPTGETLDLTGQTVTVQLYLPSGIEGPKDARSGAMLFFQDKDWTWAQTDWMNIESTNQWITISVNLDDLFEQYSGFDQTQIRAVGIKIGTNSRAGGFSYNGPFNIDNLRASDASEIQFDFDSPRTRTEKEIKDVADLKVKALRWWLFADGRAGLEYDENGFVIGLDDEFINDFDEMIRLARSSKVYLVPVLFDFLIGGEAQVVDDVQTFGHADLINDPAKRQSLLDNAVSVIFDKLAETNEVVIVDLFNEPEWLLLDSDIDIPLGKRPPEINEGGVIAIETMKTFFSEIIELYKQKGLEGKQLLTIGSASPRWVTLWEDLDLDISQFHLWNGPGQIDEGLQFDFSSPISGIPTFLGEFSTLPEVYLQNTCEFLENAFMLGYSGAFPWAYRAKDNASLPLLGEESRYCFSTFANDHPDLVEFLIPPVSPPSAPSEVTAIAGDSKVTISWVSVSEATSYNLYWATTSGVTATTGIEVPNVTSPYTHTSLSNDITYYYVITAVNERGESDLSTEVSATPASPLRPPSAPSEVTAIAGDSKVTISWVSVSEATSYNLYWATTSGVTATTGIEVPNVTSPYTHTSLSNDITYYYVITAVNERGESDLSTEVYATPASPRVVLETPEDGVELTEGEILFAWHINNPELGETYVFTVLFDKGVNPFDGWIETSVDVGEETEYTRSMSSGWWGNGFQWGVRAIDSSGRTYESETRTIKHILERE